jgi:hypothetical protein
MARDGGDSRVSKLDGDSVAHRATAVSSELAGFTRHSWNSRRWQQGQAMLGDGGRW